MFSRSPLRWQWNAVFITTNGELSEETYLRVNILVRPNSRFSRLVNKKMIHPKIGFLRQLPKCIIKLIISWQVFYERFFSIQRPAKFWKPRRSGTEKCCSECWRVLYYMFNWGSLFWKNLRIKICVNLRPKNGRVVLANGIKAVFCQNRYFDIAVCKINLYQNRKQNRR